MPKIATYNGILGEHGNPDKISFKYDVNVSSGGVFSTKLPADVVQKLEECGIQVHKNRLGNKGHIEARTIDDLVKNVKAYNVEYQSKIELSRQTVIQYYLYTDASYWLDSKGGIHPNGGYEHTGESSYHSVNDAKMDWGWKHGTTGHGAQGFGVKLKVRVIEKIHYQFKSGRKLTDMKKPQFTKDTPSLFWLSGINLSDDVFKYNVSEIPASEENAEFFVSMVKAMIAMNEKIAQFTTPEAILKLIEDKQKLLG